MQLLPEGRKGFTHLLAVEDHQGQGGPKGPGLNLDQS